MSERVQFVLDWQRGLFPMTQLCERYRISRKTGYKFVERFEQGGLGALEDLPRIARNLPHKTSAAIAKRIIQLRQRHPHWGPKKLIRILRERDPEQPWPAASTAGDILRRAGLVNSRLRRRRHPSASPRALCRPVEPNDLWTADFKGQFRTGDSTYCYPLTTCDGATRYILGIRALSSTELKPVQQSFRRLFQQYGLPRVIRTDNGSPFASAGLARLSKLSLWWTRLGIEHENIAPAHPEQNGAHERMHKTLKAETARPPQNNRRTQQLRFDSFRREFNQIRPHEALGQIPPTRLYRTSPRRFPAKLPPVEYPGHFEVRTVRSNGYLVWNSHHIYLSTALAGEPVGMEEIDDGVQSIFFGPRLLARLDERTMRVHEGAGT